MEKNTSLNLELPGIFVCNLPVKLPLKAAAFHNIDCGNYARLYFGVSSSNATSFEVHRSAIELPLINDTHAMLHYHCVFVLACKNSLSKREYETLHYISLGYNVKQVASKFVVGENAVHNILKRLYVRNNWNKKNLLKMFFYSYASFELDYFVLSEYRGIKNNFLPKKYKRKCE